MFQCGETNIAKLPEIRKKISLSKIGDNNPMKRPDVRAKVSETLRLYYMNNGSPNKGKIRSPELRERIANKLKGGKQTSESNLKRSLTLQGRPRPIEVRKKISESSVGKIMSSESCLKMSLSKKELYQEYPEKILRGEDAYWHNHPISTETRKKISEANKGKQGSMLGKTHSQETKEKMSYKHKGKKLTEEHKRKLSLSKMRENNPNWENGISFEPYSELWADMNYKKTIMERDNNKCRNQNCNNKYKRLGLHHINYNKKDCSPKNLITLCSSCNCKANFNRSKWQQIYTNLTEVISNDATCRIY